MTNFTPSVYQEAIFDFIANGRGSALIEAVAGSGKTTTIEEAVKLLDPRASILFLAFNKKIVQELESRLPSHVRVATFHKQGLTAWGRHVKDQGGSWPTIEANKTYMILDELDPSRLYAPSARRLVHWNEPSIDPDELAIYRGFVSKLVSLAKGVGVGYLVPDDERSFFELLDHFDLYLDSDSEGATEERGIEIARRVLELSIKIGDRLIDFDDMLYLPLLKNVSFWKNDFVFVDEAQDTNGVQAALLRRMLTQSGRLIAVGDSCQAIYGFRGADSEAMAKIKRDFGTTELPLSVSYRCPKAVVRLAKEIVEHIEPSETAIEGKVEDLGETWTTDVFAQEDAIICRNTSPLVDLAYSLIRSRVPCRILGREIGQGLVALIKRMKARGIEGLVPKLEKYREREIAKHTAKGSEEKAQVVDDKISSILTLIDHLDESERTIPGLIRVIESMFSDNGKGLLTLCTVHKAKGLEWNRVFLLGASELMPSPWARKDWQVKQEYNLLYVAYTRAKEELFFLGLGK